MKFFYVFLQFCPLVPNSSQHRHKCHRSIVTRSSQLIPIPSPTQTKRGLLVNISDADTKDECPILIPWRQSIKYTTGGETWYDWSLALPLCPWPGSRCCPKGTSYKRLEKLRHAERGKNLERSELHSFHRWRVQPVWPKVSAEPVASVAKDCHSASPSRNENNLFLSRHKTCLLDPQNQIWFQVLIPVRFSMS